MKKLRFFISGVLFYAFLAVILSGYTNMKAHPNINTAIIAKFKTRFLDGVFTLDKFKNYFFGLENQEEFEGEEITKGGWLEIETKTKSNDPAYWIAHGGMSADEPELPASLVHFYDPTNLEGVRYLQDLVSRIEREIDLEFNPKIDQIEWATTHPDHEYNWVNGKNAFIHALESSSENVKEAEMAFAWRALGETLHMIADMGCPPHVRDDAHPGLWENTPILRQYGDTDPYESTCGTLEGQLIGWAADKNVIDNTLKESFYKAKKVQDIAHEMAVFTNNNFFTHETISGATVEPKIHPHNTYASPKLEDCQYDEETFSFTRMIAGQKVILCRDLTYKYYMFKERGYPYVDQKSVESQARVLMPQVAEAGANVMRLFIPEIKIEIEKISNEVFKGKVIHITDDEYPVEIKYNGKMEILNSANLKEIGEVECKNGVFELIENIDKLDFDATKEGLIAQISCGGIKVRSEEKKLSSLNYRLVTAIISNSNNFTTSAGSQFANIETKNPYGMFSLSDPDWVGQLVWEENSFSCNYQEDWTDGVYNFHHEAQITGRISEGHSKLLYYRGWTVEKSTSISNNVQSTDTTELILSNIPLSYLPSSSSITYLKGSLNNVDLTDYVEKVYRCRHRAANEELNLEEEFHRVTEINLKDPANLLEFQLWDVKR